MIRRGLVVVLVLVAVYVLLSPYVDVLIDASRVIALVAR